MKTHVIVKTHEVALKGKNRPWFMRHLLENLKQATRDVGVERVWQGQMLFGLTLREEEAWPQVKERVRDCFGVAKFFRAYALPPNLEQVKAALPALLAGQTFQSFRITANRADKRFPLNSMDINRQLGAYVKDLTGARVDLSHPDLEIFLDVHPREILVYFAEIKGYGGLPVGVSGRAMALLSGGIDSPVASWLMMKRGCQVDFVHFHSYPLVDRSSIEKATELAERLTRYQYHSRLFLAPLAEIQKRIIVTTPPTYRVILYRRFMVRIAETLARQHGAKVLITGESGGQVSSQTLDNIVVIDQTANMPILRPVIGFNKEEIVQVARQIGTFPISIQPDQDCCSLFVPRHPVTAASAQTVQQLEEGLKVDELVQQALAGVQVREFTFPDGQGD